MDVLLLIILIFSIVVMLGISIYLLVVYVHRKPVLIQLMKKDLGLLSTAKFSLSLE